MNNLNHNTCAGINGIRYCAGLNTGNDFLQRFKSAAVQVSYIMRDISAAYRNDPALRGFAGAVELFSYPGVWAVFIHRFTHLLFVAGIPVIPRFISQFSRFITGIEIHPGAKIGGGFFIDHGYGVVIGETAEIGDNVTIFHQVTLGGRGGGNGKRHPTLGSNIMVGAGAKLLGDIIIGDNVKIGAGSVVVKDIAADSTAVGNPARVISRNNLKVYSPLSISEYTDFQDQ